MGEYRILAAQLRVVAAKLDKLDNSQEKRNDSSTNIRCPRCHSADTAWRVKKSSQVCCHCGNLFSPKDRYIPEGVKAEQ